MGRSRTAPHGVDGGGDHTCPSCMPLMLSYNQCSMATLLFHALFGLLYPTLSLTKCNPAGVADHLAENEQHALSLARSIISNLNAPPHPLSAAAGAGGPWQAAAAAWGTAGTAWGTAAVAGGAGLEGWGWEEPRFSPAELRGESCMSHPCARALASLYAIMCLLIFPAFAPQALLLRHTRAVSFLHAQLQSLG